MTTAIEIFRESILSTAILAEEKDFLVAWIESAEKELEKYIKQ